MVNMDTLRNTLRLWPWPVFFLSNSMFRCLVAKTAKCVHPPTRVRRRRLSRTLPLSARFASLADFSPEPFPALQSISNLLTLKIDCIWTNKATEASQLLHAQGKGAHPAASEGRPSKPSLAGLPLLGESGGNLNHLGEAADTRFDLFREAVALAAE